MFLEFIISDAFKTATVRSQVANLVLSDTLMAGVQENEIISSK